MRSAIANASSSDWSIALEHDPVKIPDFADRVVSVCFVRQTEIISDHEIADLPFGSGFLLGCMFEKPKLLRRHCRGGAAGLCVVRALVAPVSDP